MGNLNLWFQTKFATYTNVKSSNIDEFCLKAESWLTLCFIAIIFAFLVIVAVAVAMTHGFSYILATLSGVFH